MEWLLKTMFSRKPVIRQQKQACHFCIISRNKYKTFQQQEAYTHYGTSFLRGKIQENYQPWALDLDGISAIRFFEPSAPWIWTCQFVCLNILKLQFFDISRASIKYQSFTKLIKTYCLMSILTVPFMHCHLQSFISYLV